MCDSLVCEKEQKQLEKQAQEEAKTEKKQKKKKEGSTIQFMFSI